MCALSPPARALVATSDLREPHPSTTGLVLAGGRSSRMGFDKATMQLGGVTLVAHVIAALDGLDTVRVVGGSERAVADLGVEWLPDDTPGEGPLGALVTGLRTSNEDILVAAACDLPRLRSSTVLTLVDELVRSGADVAVPLIGGRLQWHVAAWDRRAAAMVTTVFESGVRSLYRAGNSLRVCAVVFARLGDFVDLDTVDDVRREFPE